MLRIFASLTTLLSLLCVPVVAQEGPPAAPSGEAQAPSPGPRDDPLGHVPPEVGERMQALMQEAAGDEVEHHGVLGWRLHGRGPVRFEYVYTGEAFTNTRGGIDTNNATQYEGLFSLGMLIDLEKVHPALPGRFFMLAQNTHGRGLTEDFVGDAQFLSSIDSIDNRMQVAEYFWEVDVLGDSLTFRLGKQDLNGEFLVTDMAGDYVNASFGISPNLAVPTFPDTSFGAVLLAQVAPDLQFKVGVWDGVPDGMTWGFSGTGITFTIGELEYTYTLAGGTLPGSFEAGIAYVSAGEVSPGEFVPQVYAWYWGWEQVLLRENICDEDDDQGMGVFLQYASGYERDVVSFKEYLGAGLVYKGPIPGRDEDIVGAGVAHARLNFGGTGRETAVEVFYKAHLTPWATVQPDLQYIASPSGLYRDSLVAGLRFEILL